MYNLDKKVSPLAKKKDMPLLTQDKTLKGKDKNSGKIVTVVPKNQIKDKSGKGF